MSRSTAQAVTSNLRAMSRASDLEPTRRLACKIPMSKEAVTQRLQRQSRLRAACIAWRVVGRALVPKRLPV